MSSRPPKTEALGVPVHGVAPANRPGHGIAAQSDSDFLTWGSAPHPGSVACGAPTPRAAPSRARRARRRSAQREQNSRRSRRTVSRGAPPHTPARSLAGPRHPAPLPRGRAVRAAVLRMTTAFAKRRRTVLTWGSAPHPGSVACGAPTPRAAPSRARRARRRSADDYSTCRGAQNGPYVGLRPTPRLGRLRGPDTPRRSLAGAPCAPPFCATTTEFASGSRITVSAWRSAPPPARSLAGPSRHSRSRMRRLSRCLRSRSTDWISTLPLSPSNSSGAGRAGRERVRSQVAMVRSCASRR